MMTDPIADMLTRIRNANAIRRKTAEVQGSRLCVGIAQVLKDEGFIASYEVAPAKPRSTIKVQLKYGQEGDQVIHQIERVSRPGRRVYSGPKELAQVLRGMGIYVLSTPKGVMSDRAARAQNVGGEVLARVS
jgi:small subunit ribosomal protein S8